MFSSNESTTNNDPSTTTENNDPSTTTEQNNTTYNKYSKYKTAPYSVQKEMGMEDLDKMLEHEQNNNKSENWNKLDKTQKIHKLNQYSDKYGREKNLQASEIKTLKTFFKDSLNKNKLQKSKDLQYDKEKGEISNIPSLLFNPINRLYTLKNMDPKRVSTVKCLHKNKKETNETKN